MRSNGVRRGQIRRLRTTVAGDILIAVVSADEMHEATSRAIVARITADAEAADTGVSVPLPEGVDAVGWIMPDRLNEVTQIRLGPTLGQLPQATVDHLNEAIGVVLGLPRY
ncbi:type II toxin-antitoxin system PemK/MazF family toxin [Phytomonospora sp. NPDC050363]|uniref:type II toxin-antitoxin system PemK/MazF family toxin n=1 Tax=Phytomonospora sp. NPDC050363 TaxID=3155642 RepID=UPI0033E4BB64